MINLFNIKKKLQKWMINCIYNIKKIYNIYNIYQLIENIIIIIID